MASAAVLISAAPPRQGAPLASAHDRSLADMKAYLARSKPQSPSEALRLLRNAYPEASLGLRVAACGLA